MFTTVLVANRGEIAVRVCRTLRRLAIHAVAVYSDADAGARHVREADEAVRLGPAVAAESYLSIDRVVSAALDVRAQAVHPGYGFLSENAAFARACAEAGLVFVGPPVHAVEVMGDKIRAKQTVAAAGVPVVPGRAEAGLGDDALRQAADEIGYPVLLKPSAGGGGKGMRLVYGPGDIDAALAGARREALSAFGDDTLFLERFVHRPRHIEVQVLADTHGSTIHLGERECSLQRRHQKVIEEAPSPSVAPATRALLGHAAVAAARAVGYAGAGTVEFIVSADRPTEFFFMEMNTRLQVEHPVTELVTGMDLVEQQLRVAAGERLSLSQLEIQLVGHAVEARVYAEDPAQGFLPTGGRVLHLREPSGPGVRVDSGLVEGMQVAQAYDPMLSKVVAWGHDRREALSRLDCALAGTAVLGVGTNTAFLRQVLAHPDVQAGRLDTGLIERDLDALVEQDPPEDVFAVLALHRLRSLTPPGPVTDPWDLPSGWRVGDQAWATWRVGQPGRVPTPVSARGPLHDARVRVGTGPVRSAGLAAGPPHAAELLVTLDGRTRTWQTAEDGSTVWVGRDGAAWALVEAPRVRLRHADDDAAGELQSPMPGTVVAVLVSDGDLVTAGQAMLVVEAMKMEHTLRAPLAGEVSALVAPAAVVALGQVVGVVTPG